MVGSNRRSLRTVLGVVIASAITGGPAPSPGQNVIRTRSFEQGLLERIDLAPDPRPGDTPRLARLVVLETISMHEYARRQLGDSPAGMRLAVEIDGLWQAAATFDRLAWAAEAGEPVAESPQAAFVRLDEAYARVESSLGAMPGLSPAASYRLDRVTRLLSDLRPRLRSTGPVPGLATAASDPFPEIRRGARDLGRQLADLLAELVPAGSRGVDDKADRVGGLAALVRQFEGILAGAPSFEGLRTAFRPVRLRASEIDALVVGQPTSAAIKSRWRAIRDEVDRLSERLGFPRVIVLRPMPPAPAVTQPRPLSPP